MEYRRLGRTGLQVSAIGFGCGGVGGLFVRGEPDAQREAVAAALEGGVNYFDTAAQYGDGASETNLGRVLSELGASPFLGTKINLAPFEVEDAERAARRHLEEGLARLGRSRVDVCTLHTRVGNEAGSLSAAEVVGPVAEAMLGLVAAGLAGAVGFTGLGDTAALKEVAESGRFDTMQCYYNVLNQSAAVPGSPDGLAQDFDGLLGCAAAKGTAPIVIRVLAGGALGGGERHPLSGGSGRPMARGEEYEEDLRRAQRLVPRLAELGAQTLSELAIRFALANAEVSTVLVGFSDREQVLEALRAERRGPIAAGAIPVAV